MSNQSTEIEINQEAFRDKAEEILETILMEEDPLELNAYKQAFKKYVPLFKRSYVAGYLFKKLLGGKSPVRTKPKGDMTSVFVSIGKNRRVFPRDLIGFFASKTGIKKEQIGEIKILDSYSFVEVDKSFADELIKALDGENFRGRRLTVNHAKKKN